MMMTLRRMAWAGVAMTAAGCVCGWGQTHKVEKPESVVRAVGVYEWTGEMTKPAASRLIPVTVFIDGKLQDAGVYLARPVPFALLTGNVYELEQSGVGKGLLDLVYARHLQPAEAAGTEEAAYDDGWFGYGSFQPLPVKRKVALKPSKTLAAIKGPADTAVVGDPDRPTMYRRHAAAGDSGTTAGGGAGTGSNTGGSAKTGGASTTTADAGVPAEDPDRPVLKRHGASGDSGDSKDAGTTTAQKDGGTGTGSTGSGGAGSGGTAGGGTGGGAGDGAGGGSAGSPSSTGGADTGGGTGDSSGEDPDRPTLKRRSPEQAKEEKKGKKKGETATVTGVGSLNDDPDRPNLHRGKPASAMTEADLPKLTGLPKELHQMVAVSDAATREQHDFSRGWTDANERAGVLAKMEGLARAQLTEYESKNGGGSLAPAASAKAAGTKARTGAGTKKAIAGAKAAAAAPAAGVEALADEDLRGYVLSYGGDATYVLTAHTVGTGAGLRYVTVVAQEDVMGQMKAAISTATDAAHLDRTPRLHLVDVVDAEASNRASLLFELREQGARQFALYRVIGGTAEQIFLSGTTQ